MGLGNGVTSRFRRAGLKRTNSEALPGAISSALYRSNVALLKKYVICRAASPDYKIGCVRITDLDISASVGIDDITVRIVTISRDEWQVWARLYRTLA